MADYNVKAILTANVTALISGMKEAQASVEAFGKSTTSIGKSVPAMMTGIGKGLTAGLTVPITAGFAASVKASSDFQSALIGVQKTTNMSGKELDAMAQSIKNMAREVPATTTEIAAVAEAAGQLGISKDHIMDFTRTMIDLKETTNLTSEEAAVAFARFANITQMPQEQIENLGSSVVELGNNFATSEKEIVSMGLRLAATGTQIGLNQAEIMGLATAMSSVGISAEAGGSAMSTVMQKINTAVLSSSEHVKGFAQVAGMSAQEFSTAWKEQPTVAIEEFVKGLKRIQDSGGDVNSTLSELGINGIREVDTLARLAGAGDMVGQAFDMANESFRENSALSEEAALRYESFDSKVQNLKNTFNEVGVVIGDMLLPHIQKAMDLISGLLKKFLELDPGAQQAIVAFAGMAAAAGPLLIIIGKLPGELTKVKTGLNVLKLGGLAFKKLAAEAKLSFLLIKFIAKDSLVGIGPMFTKMGGLAKGAFGIIAAHPFVALGAAAAVGVGLIIANWDKIGPVVTKVWDNIKTKASETWNNLKESTGQFVENFKTKWQELPESMSNIWTSIKEKTSEAWDGIKENIGEKATGIKESLGTTFEGVKESMGTTWDNIKTTVVEKVSSMGEGITAKLEPIKGNIDGAWNGVKSVTKGAWDFIKNIVIGAALIILQAITGDLKGAGESARQIWENLKQSTQQIWDGIKEVIKNATEAMKTIAKGAMDAIKTAVKTAWDNVKTTTKTIWDGVKETLKTTWDNIKETVKTAVENVKTTVKTGFENAKESVKTSVENIKTNIKEGFNKAKENVKTAVENIKTTVKTGFTNVLTTIKTTVKQIPTAIKNAFTQAISAARNFISQAVQVGRDLINGFIQGITEMASNLANAARNAVSGAIGAAKSALRIGSPSRVFKEIGYFTVKGFALGLENNAKMAASAMDKVIDPLTSQDIDIASDLGRINGKANRVIDYNINDKLGSSKQNQTLILKLGSKDYKAFIDDITSAQGQEIKLQEIYGI